MYKQDRRSIYRVTPDSADNMAVTLRTPSGQQSAAEVVDINVDGAGTRIASGEAIALGIGERVRLSLSSSRFSAPVELEATVVGKKERESEQDYSFHFQGQGDVETQFPQEFYEMFNRRGAYRAVEPENENPIDVGLCIPDSAGVRSVGTARLINISATGMGAMAKLSTDQAMGDNQFVEISLGLPPNMTAINLGAWIHNREFQDKGIYYGLKFDARRSRDFLAMEEEIVDYVMCRYYDKMQQGTL